MRFVLKICLVAACGLVSRVHAQASSAPVEVAVQGTKNTQKRLQESAEAVTVIDTRIAKQQSADLGEVLARTQGIAVQRDAGLGSPARISLNGMSGAAVKFFVDGIPLEEAGYAALADVPVNLVERVEIYRGVVPIRFGADALGGAINIVTDTKASSHLGASYQVGAFGTQRVNVNGRYRNAETGLMAGGSAYYDYAKNNYEIDVRVPGVANRAVDARVRRNHDEYRGYGAQAELGVLERSWARRLSLTGFVSSFDKEYQSNATQTVPYGEARGTTTQYGVTLRYAVDLARDLSLELTGNYRHSRDHFRDLANWVYNWSGTRIRPRRTGGELDPYNKSNLVTWEDMVFGRAVVQWSITPQHIVRLSSTPETPWRGGEERVAFVPGERNKGSAKRRMVTVVSGLEYEANLLHDRLTNIIFVKDYWQYNTGEERALFTPGDRWNVREHTIHKLGFGDSLRCRFLPWLYGKLSYEYATRLPEPEEFFGDGLMIVANYDLQSEVSHNGNVGLHAESGATSAGELTVDVNGFIREVDNLIVPLGLQYQKYENVAATSGAGVDSSLAWLSPGRYVAVNGMLTWQDIRNVSTEGDYAKFKNARVPSDPWLFASWSARFSFPDVLGHDTRLEPFYYGRYVHAFHRSWDNYGDPQFQITLPYQITQNLGITWVATRERRHLSVTLELDNFTDAKVFDVFGAQRPGRAFYAKITGDLR